MNEFKITNFCSQTETKNSKTVIIIFIIERKKVGKKTFRKKITTNIFMKERLALDISRSQERTIIGCNDLKGKLKSKYKNRRLYVPKEKIYYETRNSNN